MLGDGGGKLLLGRDALPDEGRGSHGVCRLVRAGMGDGRQYRQKQLAAATLAWRVSAASGKRLPESIVSTKFKPLPVFR